jgi:hypothetical protein
MGKYRMVSDHVQDRASGVMVAVGEVIELTSAQEADDHNRLLIDEGTLIPVADDLPLGMPSPEDLVPQEAAPEEEPKGKAKATTAKA